MKKLSILLMTCLLCVSNFLPVYAEETEFVDSAEEAMDNTEFEEVVEDSVVISDLEDNNTLFDAYLNEVMGSSISLYSITDQVLSPEDPLYSVYCTLKESVRKVAMGESTNVDIYFKVNDGTAIDIPLSSIHLNQMNPNTGVPYSTINCLVNQLLAYLSMDCPQYLYWYDKTVGSSPKRISSESDTTLSLKSLHMVFPISKDYQDENGNIDSNKIQSVPAALQNAQSIIDKYENCSDFEKLKGYVQEICDLNTYNSAATAAGYPYGDPWQIIYLFDGDPNTNVVCEGYSKGFQYLCDRTFFENENINCISPWGSVKFNSYSNGGAHMWNIVTMDDGKNYLLDLTNIDSGSNLFLVGATTTDGVTYTDVNCRYRYTYADNVLDVFNGYLQLNEKNYLNVEQIDIEQTDIKIEKDLGDVILNVNILPEGISVQDLQWDSTDTSVATVYNGVISPMGIGTCEIIASGSNGKKAVVHVEVRDEIDYQVDDSTLIMGGHWELEWIENQFIPFDASIDSVILRDNTLIDDGIFSDVSLSYLVIPKAISSIPDFKAETYYVYRNSVADSQIDGHKIYMDDLDLEVKGYKVVLDGRIGCQFYVDIDDTFKDAMIEVETSNGLKAYNIADLEKDGDMYIVCVYVDAKECMDEISIRLVNNLTEYDKHLYSIQEYANYLLEHETDEKVLEIIRALMTYAYYAQIYFDYNTDNLPSSINSLVDMDCGDVDTITHTSSLRCVGTKIVCKDVLSIKLYFNENTTLYVDGIPYKTVKDGSYYSISIDNVKDVYHSYSISNDSFNMKYSVANYKYRAQNEDLINLLNACMMYYVTCFG